MITRTSLREIAGLLRSLVSTSPSNGTEVEGWTLRAGEVYDGIRERYPDIPLPYEIRHYLNDADIRARDPGYREHQNLMMTEIIRSLELGVVPRSHVVAVPVFPGVTLSFRRSCLAWVAGIAVIAVGFGVWRFL